MDEFKTEKISDNLLTRLEQSKVLPFLDLTIHSQRENVDLPHHVIGDWLFPDEDIDVTAKIGKTTKPLAMKSIKDDFIRRLLTMR